MPVTGSAAQGAICGLGVKKIITVIWKAIQQIWTCILRKNLSAAYRVVKVIRLHLAWQNTTVSVTNLFPIRVH